MNLPITVDLTVQTNNVVFAIEKQDIAIYPLTLLEEPITVNLSADTSKTVFAMACESNLEQIELNNETAIIVQGDSDVPYYDGDYIVIPKAKSQTVLQTKNKRCRENITVVRIQTAQTHNTYGTTFYIAEVS